MGGLLSLSGGKNTGGAGRGGSVVIAAGAVVTDDMDDYETWIGDELYG
jgi:hypothetical protein